MAKSLVLRKARQIQSSRDAGLACGLQQNSIECEDFTVSLGDNVPWEKKEQLQAVKRWFENDWRRIEPKLRTSIVEGISVFLSLFDDNPIVKRTLCPPECYDPVANADGKFGNPMPPMFCYLKAYYNDVDKSYFCQMADGGV
jgi:hypothetical protein